LFQKIQDLKHPHHRNCALWLQKREADIIIDGVIGKIARGPKFPVLTVHDSVLTLPEFVPQATGLLEMEFQNYFGIPPKLKTTDYGWSESATIESQQYLSFDSKPQETTNAAQYEGI
jgi:hypothetical protein